jgi:prepilin-type N-terminal cleavage/methylation domain-containing protein
LKLNCRVYYISRGLHGRICQAKTMKSYENKTGITLVEMLIVVAIIVILAAITVSTATWVQTRAKVDLAKSTIELLSAALEQFKDYEYQHKDDKTVMPTIEYSRLKFPLDCNDFYASEVQDILCKTLGLAAGNVTISGGTYDPNYSGIAVLYFFLNRVPTSHKTLEKIDKSLITNLDKNKQQMTITIISGNTNTYPFYRIVDPWGKSLHYDYYDENKIPAEQQIDTAINFPIITSAGPDGKFDTADDISSK